MSGYRLKDLRGRRAVLTMLLSACVATAAFGQAGALPGAKTAAPAKSSSAAKSNGTAAKTRSVHEIRKETLLYGIDSQVISLLGTLTQEKDTSLNGEVEQVLSESPNPQVQQAALDFLDSVKDWKSAAVARGIVSNRIQSGATGNDKLVTAAIQYLTDAKDTSALPLIDQLVQDQSQAVAYEALISIGKMGTSKQAAVLLKDLKDPSFSAVLKPQVVLALGQLKSEAAVPELTKILKNPDEDATMREYACAALGEIGNPKSLPAIKSVFSASHNYLRAYAVSSLANFSGQEVNALLMQALKDSFWRVRVNAADSLGEKKVASAVPILEYKARYDPELVVRRAALTAIGSINNAAAISFLREVFSNSLVDPSLRMIAVQELVKNDLNGSLTEIEKYVHKNWDHPSGHLFDYVCQQLSQAKNPRLEVIFQHFLTSPNLDIQIYGLRGIRNNDFKALLKKVEPFDNPANNLSVRAAAEAAIRKLK